LKSTKSKPKNEIKFAENSVFPLPQNIVVFEKNEKLLAKETLKKF
jgi:hypothetical protein